MKRYEKRPLQSIETSVPPLAWLVEPLIKSNLVDIIWVLSTTMQHPNISHYWLD